MVFAYKQLGLGVNEDGRVISFVTVCTYYVSGVLNFSFLTKYQFSFPTVTTFLGVTGVRVGLGLYTILRNGLYRNGTMFPEVCCYNTQHVRDAGHLVKGLQLVYQGYFLVPGFGTFGSIYATSFVGLLGNFYLLFQRDGGGQASSLVERVGLFTGTLYRFKATRIWTHRFYTKVQVVAHISGNTIYLYYTTTRVILLFGGNCFGLVLARHVDANDTSCTSPGGDGIVRGFFLPIGCRWSLTRDATISFSRRSRWAIKCRPVRGLWKFS